MDYVGIAECVECKTKFQVTEEEMKQRALCSACRPNFQEGPGTSHDDPHPSMRAWAPGEREAAHEKAINNILHRLVKIESRGNQVQMVRGQEIGCAVAKLLDNMEKVNDVGLPTEADADRELIKGLFLPVPGSMDSVAWKVSAMMSRHREGEEKLAWAMAEQAMERLEHQHRQLFDAFFGLVKRVYDTEQWVEVHERMSNQNYNEIMERLDATEKVSGNSNQALFELNIRISKLEDSKPNPNLEGWAYGQQDKIRTMEDRLDALEGDKLTLDFDDDAPRVVTSADRIRELEREVAREKREGDDLPLEVHERMSNQNYNEIMERLDATEKVSGNSNQALFELNIRISKLEDSKPNPNLEGWAYGQQDKIRTMEDRLDALEGDKLTLDFDDDAPRVVTSADRIRELEREVAREKREGDDWWNKCIDAQTAQRNERSRGDALEALLKVANQREVPPWSETDRHIAEMNPPVPGAKLWNGVWVVPVQNPPIKI